jgi:hypothetical protein
LTPNSPSRLSFRPTYRSKVVGPSNSTKTSISLSSRSSSRAAEPKREGT